MKKNWLGILLFALIFVTSCTGTKHLPDGQQLYVGSEFKFEPKGEIEHNKSLKASLNKTLVPKPNRKFLGLFRVRTSIYQKLKPKKKKGFKAWLKKKMGEPPVLVADQNINIKKKIVQKTMQDNGYFNTEVEAEIVTKKRNDKLAKVIYNIKNSGPTYIDTFSLPKGNGAIDSLLLSYKDYKVKAGDQYNLNNIIADRNGLNNLIRSKGYYNFNKDNIVYVVDTSTTKHFNMDLVIRQPKEDSIHKKYYIRNVVIYPSYNGTDSAFWRESIYPTLGTQRKRQLQRIYDNPSNHQFFDIRENERFITRKVIAENVFIEPGNLFSLQDYELTSGRLVGLGLYKFVSIDYEKADDSLDVKILLTPTKYKNFKTGFDLSSSTLGFLGSSLNFSYNNKNTSNKAINLGFTSGIGTEFQITGGQFRLNNLDVNFGLSFTVPRRLRFKPEKLKTLSTPTTSFAINENFQRWIQFYTYNDLNLEYKYTWQPRLTPNSKRPTITHEVTPANFSWLYLLSTTARFDSLLVNNSQLQTSFENNFIIGSKYKLTINTQYEANQRNFWLLQNSFETSGNLAYAIAKIGKPNLSKFNILGIPFSQFFQAEIDYRNYWSINSKTKLVSRINVGVGVAYGNRAVLPYSRQYFMGGPNTIRAFANRTIGPGSFRVPDAENNTNNSIEQTGDLKLLMNIEYRWTIYKFLRAATFLDIGNVWLLRDDPSRPNAVFQPKTFAQQLAIGTGVGLRVDFNFIAVRLDLGIPLYKPFNEQGERWVWEKPWRNNNNMVWNFSIGYPF